MHVGYPYIGYIGYPYATIILYVQPTAKSDVSPGPILFIIYIIIIIKYVSFHSCLRCVIQYINETGDHSRAAAGCVEIDTFVYIQGDSINNRGNHNVHNINILDCAEWCKECKFCNDAFVFVR